MAVSGRNKKRNRKRSAEELARIKDATRRAALGASEIALFALPGGAIIRLAKTGGKFAPGALAALKRRFSNAKEIKNPSKSQIDKAKPPSAVKPTTATRGGQQSGRVTVTDKQKSSGSTPKLEQKPTVIPKPRTSVTTRPSSTTKPTPKPNRSNRAKIIGGGATGAAVAVIAGKALKDQKPTKAEEPKRTPDTKKISPKGRPGATTPDTKKISPKGRPGSTTPDTKKISPKGRPGSTTPDTKKMPPKGRPITAGKNTGFGPKGNIFPSNAAERAALMKMYGGTGSAAAKAAAAGKQGDLKAGKAAYEKAKKDRRKKSS